MHASGPDARFACNTLWRPPSHRPCPCGQGLPVLVQVTRAGPVPVHRAQNDPKTASRGARRQELRAAFRLKSPSRCTQTCVSKRRQKQSGPPQSMTGTLDVSDMSALQALGRFFWGGRGGPRTCHERAKFLWTLRPSRCPSYVSKQRPTSLDSCEHGVHVEHLGHVCVPSSRRALGAQSCRGQSGNRYGKPTEWVTCMEGSGSLSCCCLCVSSWHSCPLAFGTRSWDVHSFAPTHPPGEEISLCTAVWDTPVTPYRGTWCARGARGRDASAIPP